MYVDDISFLFLDDKAFLKHGATNANHESIPISLNPVSSMQLELSLKESTDALDDKTPSTVNHSMGNGTMKISTPSTAERAAVNALQSPEKVAVNALLMAAIAMTEMGGEKKSSESILTPSSSSKKNTSSPEDTGRSGGQFETPQRYFLKKFKSPKLNASNATQNNSRSQNRETHPGDLCPFVHKPLSSVEQFVNDDGDDDESPKRDRENADGLTTSIDKKAKRSCLGTAKKDILFHDREHIGIIEQSLGAVPMAMATPAKSTVAIVGKPITDLTPVSARCIDFKKMRVNDASNDPALSTGCP